MSEAKTRTELASLLIECGCENATLRAELERVTAERDAVIELAAQTDKVLMACMDTATEAEMREVQALEERDALTHWRQKYMELAKENTRLEGERDAARAAAAAWKRSAKTRYRVEQYVVGKIDSRRQWQETKEHFYEAYND